MTPLLNLLGGLLCLCVETLFSPIGLLAAGAVVVSVVLGM